MFLKNFFLFVFIFSLSGYGGEVDLVDPFLEQTFAYRLQTEGFSEEQKENVQVLRFYFQEKKKTNLPIGLQEGIPLNGVTVLSFSHTFLTDFPQEFSELINLEYLTLSYNKIKRVPTFIPFLKSLKVLLLDHNFLKEIPKNLIDLPSLKVLDLSYNQLKYPMLSSEELVLWLEKGKRKPGFILNLCNNPFLLDEQRDVFSEKGNLLEGDYLKEESIFLEFEQIKKEQDFDLKNEYLGKLVPFQIKKLSHLSNRRKLVSEDFRFILWDFTPKEVIEEYNRLIKRDEELLEIKVKKEREALKRSL
jgi:hypothetical protein